MSLSLPDIDLGRIDLDVVTSPPHKEGRIFYDSTEHTLAVYNDEADITLQLGQEDYVRVYNDSGATITNGNAVYVSGTEVTENRPTIALARADAKSTATVIGFSTHDIENNSYGYITSQGLINDLDTSAFASGDAVYLDETTAGAFRSSPPPEGNFEVLLGFIIRVDVSLGRILVTIVPNLGLPSGDAKEIKDS